MICECCFLRTIPRQVCRLTRVMEFFLVTNFFFFKFIHSVCTVMVTYHVGSRNEAIGYTGSTHLLEHLMFKGATEYNKVFESGLPGNICRTRNIRNFGWVSCAASGERQDHLERAPEVGSAHQRDDLERPHELL
jgi:predicted Zn-dependent peptidase